MSDSRIIVSLDFSKREMALELARSLTPERCRMKVGKELFTRYGPAVVRELVELGYDVFLDLKFHDIPNTVALPGRVGTGRLDDECTCCRRQGNAGERTRGNRTGTGQAVADRGYSPDKS